MRHQISFTVSGRTKEEINEAIDEVVRAYLSVEELDFAPQSRVQVRPLVQEWGTLIPVRWEADVEVELP